MKMRIAGIEIPVSFLFIAFVLMLQASAAKFPIINVWPKPTTFSWPQPQFTILSPNLTIYFPDHNKYLRAAVSRYSKLFLTENYRPLPVPLPQYLNLTSSPPIQTLRISVSDVTTELTDGVNESYSLSIPSSTTAVLLSAETVWGAIRGLETFSQLIINYGGRRQRSGPAAAVARVASGLYIRDEPLYGHRGVMLDTGRNYYPVEDLLRLIKALSMNKLNVFHWHITDSHSFPLVLPSEPELAGKGSYGEDMMYSPDDVKRVVEFGMEYGVRVVPEIDMPGQFLIIIIIFFTTRKVFRR